MSSLDARSASTLARIRRNYRRNTQLDAVQAVLGDEYGRVSVEGQSEYYYVRIINGENEDGSSQYGRAFPVLTGAGYMGSEQIGTEVYIGVAYDGQWAILGTDRAALVEKGISPRGENVNSPYRQFNYMKNADLLLAVPLGTVATPTLEVRVEPSWYITDGGTLTMFPGGVIDLAGDVPAADADDNAQHLISAIFINSSGALESVTSTAKLTDDAISWGVDVLEAFGNRSARAIPIRYYVLYTEQTLLTKADDYGDGREWITAPKRRNNFAATAAPGVTDDIDLRYEIGSMWFDVTNDISYVCIDSTDGAAVWIELAGPNAGTIDTRYIAVTGDTATGQILIDLSSDEVGLAIEGDAAQTAELQQWRTSASEVGVAISPNAKALRFWDVGASHYVGFTPPALTASQLWVLPSADGTANQVLKTDGSGNLGWATAGGGSSPLTTKGDLYGYAAADARIPVGSNGEALFADSAQALGVDWKAAPEISSQAGTPSSTPSYLVDLNIDTTNDRVFGAANTSANMQE